MADVRLTATNPEDSSVVPVACNEKGELKLEEIPDQSFDGNLEGNLTVSGEAEFTGDLSANQGIFKGTVDAERVDAGSTSNAAHALTATNQTAASGSIYARNNHGGKAPCYEAAGGDGSVKAKISNDGSATFAGDKVFIDYGGGVYLGNAPLDQPPYTNRTISLNNNGSVTFAGNKAGFTAEGYLWCTTRRGDMVILDVTSNGLASWVPYTPPNRLTELQDKWAEKDGILPVPHESSQEEPETPQ